MADFVKITEYLYTGVASDTKPTAATTPKGTKAIDTDTGAEWINNGVAFVEVSPKTTR